jgi:hypothetical protein
MTAWAYSVYDGRDRIGFVVRRHWVNDLAVAYEAFDTNERPLGAFESEQDAAAAIWRHARGQS